MTVISIEHIDVDENGVARVVGHRTKVIQLVMDKMANDWGPDQIRAQYPHLSLAQIHAAFAYYYDHQAELDAHIQTDLAESERLRNNAGTSLVIEKLRASGKLR